jgi:hypothetical protein
MGLFVPGRPAVWWGAGESAWKAKLRRAITVPVAHPHLVFTVSSFKRGGSYFDLENPAKPVLDIAAPQAETVWASMQLGTHEGVEIEDCLPPQPTRCDLSTYIAVPAVQSSTARPTPPELAAFTMPLGDDEPLGLALAFDSAETAVAILDFTGPIKALIDDLQPLLGSYPQKGRDYRIRELRITRGHRPGAEGVTIQLWFLEEPAAPARAGAVLPSQSAPMEKPNSTIPAELPASTVSSAAGGASAVRGG